MLAALATITMQDAGEAAALEAGGMLDALRDLPIGAHSIAVFGLLVGVVVWAFGRRFLRTGFALVGLLTGSTVGFFAAGAVPSLDALPVPSPYVGLGLGAFLGLIGAVLLFRVIMAASTAAIMAIIGVLAAATYLDLKLEPVEAEQDLPVEELFLDGPEAAPLEHWSVFDEEDPGQVEAAAMGATVKTRRFLSALGDELGTLWERLPDQSQLVVLLSAALGGAVGALSGIAAPKRAAGAITSMLGAAVWLPCALWLAHVQDIPAREMVMEHGPVGYAVIWLGAAAVGIVIQWTALPKTQETVEED